LSKTVDHGHATILNVAHDVIPTPGGTAQAPTEAFSFDVTEADFEQQVLERSLQVPVLLDCWAPWCGPCRSLGPVLEKLVKAYAGQFVLAKLDTDKAPQISAALQIRSIPLVALFIGGQVVDQFTGALPEGQIRAFLDKHIQGDVIDAEVQQVFGPLDQAAELMLAGDLAQAQTVLDGMPAAEHDEEHARLTTRLQALVKLANAPPGASADELAARIKSNPKDFDARFELAALHASKNEWPLAFEQLLDTVLRDKTEARERARLQMVEWFNVCADADAVSKARRYLGMYLN
jgi:putative thioredoxin